LQEVEGRLAVGRHQDAVAFLAQGNPDKLADALIIIDNEYRSRAGSSVSTGAVTPVADHAGPSVPCDDRPKPGLAVSLHQAGRFSTHIV